LAQEMKYTAALIIERCSRWRGEPETF
jgi:hypothetical protein